MPKTFVIADTHFGHAKIIEFERDARFFPTIKDHDTTLIANWNAVVSHDDKVWHLGDVLFSQFPIEYLNLLNGSKYLIAGNHDRIERLAPYFVKIYGAIELVKGIIATHIPVHPGQFTRYKGNIHGHVHSKTLTDSRYFNASCEAIGLAPINLDVILREFRKRKIYDDYPTSNIG